MKTDFDSVLQAVLTAIKDSKLTVLKRGSEFGSTAIGIASDEVPFFGHGGENNSNIIFELTGLAKGQSVGDNCSNVFENFRGVLLCPIWIEKYFNKYGHSHPQEVAENH